VGYAAGVLGKTVFFVAIAQGIRFVSDLMMLAIEARLK
jgi:hypothetical protein